VIQRCLRWVVYRLGYHRLTPDLFYKGSQEKKHFFPGRSFLDVQPAPWSKIVFAFRSVNSGRYNIRSFGFLYQRFSSLLGDEASHF
jgi:hypothetical protein